MHDEILENDTPESWKTGIDAMHSQLILESYENDEPIFVENERWSITDCKYSQERNRLTFEVNGGDVLFIFEYSKNENSLIVSVWTERRMRSQCTDPDYDDDGIDEESMMVLQLKYRPQSDSRPRPQRELYVRDDHAPFDYAAPELVKLFSFLIGKLEAYAGKPLKRSFEFSSLLDLSRNQETLAEAVRLMKDGMNDSWRRMIKDWDVLPD